MFYILALGLASFMSVSASATQSSTSAAPVQTPIPGDYTGPLRPQVHFSAPKNWLNDPNGLFRDTKGTWHLYYQFDPAHVDGGNPLWGHATSTDLYHWENQPIAISPPREGTSVYSGSAVIDVNNTSGFFSDQDDGVVAMYTLDSDVEVQEIAYSKNGGQIFKFYENNPVIPSTLADFRDPKVIRYGDHWAMVVSYAADQTIGVFTSSDLKTWTATSNFTSPDGSNYECPNLVKLPVRGATDGSVVGHKYVLTLGVGGGSPLGGSSIQYFIGDFDGESFAPDDEEIRYLDWTKDNYAAQFYYGLEENDDAVLIGWAANLEYTTAGPTAEEGWRGAMTVPRSMYLTKSSSGKFNLVSNPFDLAPIIDQSLGQKSLGPNDSFTVDYTNVESNAVHLELEVKNMDLSGGSSGVNITFSSSSGSDALRAGYRFDEKATVFIDRSGIHGNVSSPLTPEVFEVASESSDASWYLQMIVDRSVADVFDGKGAHPGTVLFYPKESLTQLKVETFGLSSSSEVSVTLSSLKSIWR